MKRKNRREISMTLTSRKFRRTRKHAADKTITCHAGQLNPKNRLSLDIVRSVTYTSPPALL